MAANGRPSPGDLTGRQKQAANKEVREEQASRAAEISMQDGAEAEVERHGVFDAQSGAQIDGPAGSKQAVMVEDPPVTRFGRPQEQVFTGQEAPEEVLPAVADRKTFTPPPSVVRSSRVRIRVDADIEDMTYGMVNGEPNNFTFKEGLTYEVPLAVADHLNERGLVRQWISG
jgi:hypothetical protein